MLASPLTFLPTSCRADDGRPAALFAPSASRAAAAAASASVARLRLLPARRSTGGGLGAQEWGTSTDAASVELSGKKVEPAGEATGGEDVQLGEINVIVDPMFAGKTTVVLHRHRPWLELAGDGGCGASPPFAAPNRDPVLCEALELVFFSNSSNVRDSHPGAWEQLLMEDESKCCDWLLQIL